MGQLHDSRKLTRTGSGRAEETGKAPSFLVGYDAAREGVDCRRNHRNCGKAMTNENSHARSQRRATRGDRPRFGMVMTSDLTPDISSDMQRAKTIPRYLAESMNGRG